MLKTSLIGIAAVAAATAFVAPASAQQHRLTRLVGAYGQVNYCADHEPGNPYNRDTDYLGWSAWRVRGGWDASNDYNCLPSRMSRSGF
jgi:hypothetical protein